MPTVKDVAKKAGVSIATVSRFINSKGFISDELKKRIGDAIKELDFKPNLVARSLKIKKSNIIGIIFPDISDPFFTILIKTIEAFAYKNNYSVILCNTEYSPEREKIYINVLKGNQVDGYITISTLTDKNYISNALKNENVVFLDRSLGLEDEIFIKLNNIRGIEMAIDYLLSLGHKKIGIIMGPMNITTGVERLEGYKQALSKNNISLNQDYIKFADSSIEAAGEMAKELLSLKNRPTAILASNNSTTLGLLFALKELKMNIPQDLSIVSFGELIYSKLIEPTLTTIKQPIEEFGINATKVLLNLINKKKIQSRTIVLEPEIFIGDSCKRIP